MATYQKETALFKEGAISEIKDQVDETQQYFWVKSGTDSEAGAHITKKTREEFELEPENGEGNVLITSDGMNVRNGLTSLAKFGSTTRIGIESDRYLQLTADGMALLKKRVSGYDDSILIDELLDLRQNNEFTKIETTTVQEPTGSIETTYNIARLISVKVNDVIVTSSIGYNRNFFFYKNSQGFTNGDVVKIEYAFNTVSATGAPLELSIPMALDPASSLIMNCDYDHPEDWEEYPNLCKVHSLSPRYIRNTEFSKNPSVTVSARRWGQMVQVNMRFSKVASSAGEDMARGYLSNLPKPVGIVRGVSYNSSTIGILNMGNTLVDTGVEESSELHDSLGNAIPSPIYGYEINMRVNETISTNASSYFYFELVYLTSSSTLNGNAIYHIFPTFPSLD